MKQNNIKQYGVRILRGAMCLALAGCFLGAFADDPGWMNPDFNPASPGDPDIKDTPARYPVTVKPNQAGGGSVSPSGSFTMKEGDEQTIYAYPERNYELVRWNVNGRDTVASSPLRITMGTEPIDVVAVFEFNPRSPGNPDIEDTPARYSVTVKPNQVGGGSVSPSGSFTMKEGDEQTIYAYPEQNYKLVRWNINGRDTVASSPLRITMGTEPIDVVAFFEFNPGSPGDPSVADTPLTHPVTVNPDRAGEGSLSPSGSFKMEEGEERTIYAYPETNYELVKWSINGRDTVAPSPLKITMGTEPMDIVAYFAFNPSSPYNPGANSWNSDTGELIIDDFRPGNLYSVAYSKSNNSLESVTSFIVKGIMNDNDMGIIGYLDNASSLDLSRTSGARDIPSYLFDNSNASSIVLPSVISSIGSYAFYGCQNLTALTVYANEPPKVNSDSFANFGGLSECILYVPAASVPLYQEAEGWKLFATILPINFETYVLQVDLPEDASDGRYKNCSLEIANTATGVRQKYVISDRMLYTFNGLQKNEQYNVYLLSRSGLEIGRIENVTISGKDIEVAFDSLKPLHTVYAKVLNSEGNDVTGQVAVEWLKPLADGTVSYLRKGESIGEIPGGEQLICRVTLDNELGVAYAVPEDTMFTAGESDNTCTVNLLPFRGIKLYGTIVNSDEMPISGASVSINQTLNGRYFKTYTAKTDSTGSWSASVLDAPETRMTFAAAECVSVNDTIGAFDSNLSTLDVGRTTMKSIVGARVTYGFTYHAAGVEEKEESYSDYQNVAVSVFNVTQNRSHDDISLQYPTLAVLDEHINSGDVLRLTATSKTGAFNPVEKTVTVGENQRAEVIFDIVGKGGITAAFEMTDNPAVIAMLYSSKGELLKMLTYSESSVLFTELEDGDYTIVSMGQSDLMSSILRLSIFDEIGLSEGKDYVKNTAKVESGRITEIRNSEIPAFDESVFYYTNSMAGFSANKSSITTGNYLTLRSNIDFKNAYKDKVSNVALVVDLPEACDFVAQSVMQGSRLLPYTLDNNRLTVQLGDNYRGQTRFCVIPTNGGTFNATASVVFDYNGKSVTQPIGSAVSEIKDIEIVVPASTPSGNFMVSGKAARKSSVNVYVDGAIFSHTETNANGDWYAECHLENPEKFSEHFVYAEFVTPGGSTLLSETKPVIYNPFEIVVKDVEMTFYNGWYRKQYSVIWDFINGKTNCKKYDFYTKTNMTFLVDIAYNDIKLIPFVWLHVYTSDGKVRSLRADYDKSKDKWIAVDEFSSSALPTRVSVSVENMMFNLSDEVAYNLLMDEFIGDISLKDVNEKDGKINLSYTDGKGEDLAEVSAYESDKSVDEVISDLKSDGYIEDERLDDDSDYVPEDENDKLEEEYKVLTKPDNGSFVIVCPGGPRPRVVIIRLIKEENKQSVPERVSSTISRTWLSFIRTYFDEQACAQITEYKKYSEHLEKYVTVITSALVAHTIFIDPKLLPENITKIPKKQIIAKIRRIRHSSKRYTTWVMEYAVVPKNCKPKPPKPPLPPAPPVDPILDPSGFVYEAVPANRVEGVQATIYYKETKEDMYGDPYEDIVLWDAEEYAQKNPLFTDENGMYQWDVPQGLWQVKFEKDGYQTAYSEWLPVPPPQLEVNIGMVQNKQPEVTEARAYKDGVEVQFDKYMDPSTLTADNIYVTANGEKLNGEIRLIDSALADEYAEEDDADATRYASRLRFVPEEPLAVTTGEILLTVSRNVLSYAGIPMTQTFSQTLDVEKEVQDIVAEDVKVLYGGEKEVTVYALPSEAAAGRTLRISNSSDLIATVESTEAVLDEEGKAVVKVKGDLPGRAQLSFSIDDVAATGSCAIDVVEEIVTAEAPVSSRASGTAVYRGTKITLTTDTKGGVIYFTTDGSCPCDENGTRRKYTVPIVINEDTKILAMTSVGEGEGDVSETVEFNYTLKQSDMEFRMPAGWTWISHSLENSVDLEEVASASVEHVLGQSKEAVRDPKLGLVGELKALEPGEMYKVYAIGNTSSSISGSSINPATPIRIAAGWNWLGYPSDQTMSLDEAFANTAVADDDYIVGQDGFAQFDGQAWVGTLGVLNPGMGYMYRSVNAKDVVFNTSIVSKARSIAAKCINADNAWVADKHAYPSVMPVVAELFIDDDIKVEEGVMSFGAFCGSECRGVGKYVNGLMMVSVYGNIGDKISFRAVDNSGREYSPDFSLTFNENMQGSLSAPLQIVLKETSGIDSIYGDGAFDVTVMGSELIVNGDIDAIDALTIFDNAGLGVLSKNTLTTNTISLDGFAKGVYVVVIKAGDSHTYRKIVIR